MHCRHPEMQPGDTTAARWVSSSRPVLDGPCATLDDTIITGRNGDRECSTGAAACSRHTPVADRDLRHGLHSLHGEDQIQPPQATFELTISQEQIPLLGFAQRCKRLELINLGSPLQDGSHSAE